jgi:hypothetical protein
MDYKKIKHTKGIVQTVRVPLKLPIHVAKALGRKGRRENRSKSDIIHEGLCKVIDRQDEGE